MTVTITPLDPHAEETPGAPGVDLYLEESVVAHLEDDDAFNLAVDMLAATDGSGYGYRPDHGRNPNELVRAARLLFAEVVRLDLVEAMGAEFYEVADGNPDPEKIADAFLAGFKQGIEG